MCASGDTAILRFMPVESKPDRVTSLSDDRPIASSAEDRFDRSAFAKRVASSISGWQRRESLIMALTGPWGTGKSSVKNLVLEQLKSQPDEHIVVDFNPWQTTLRRDVLQALFTHLSSVIEPYQGGRDVAKLLTRHARTLGVFGKALTGAEQVVPGLLILVASGSLTAIGLWLGAPWIVPLASFVGLAAIATPPIGRAATNVSEFMTATFSKEDSPEATKAALVKAIARLSKVVVIVVDDIDRLPPDELKDLVQLIKTNADLPGVVYLLLFDADVVEASLGTILGVSGAEYLKKIVQVPLQLPALSRDQLDGLLFEAVDNQISGVKLPYDFDRKRWNEVYSEGIAPLLNTPRDVRRYANTLWFHLNLLQAQGVLNVDMIDLLALEALRVFEPKVYETLPSMADVLTRTSSLAPHEKDPHEKRWADLLGQCRNRDAVRAILTEVFPGIARLSNRFQIVRDHAENETLRCHRRTNFSRYFRFCVDSTDIEQADVEHLINSSTSQEAFHRALKTLHDEGKVKAALQRLNANRHRLPAEAAVPTITGLMDIAAQLPEAPGPFEPDPEIYAFWLAEALLGLTAGDEARAAVLIETTRRASDIGILARVVELLSAGKDLSGPPIMDEAHWSIVKTAVVSRVRSQPEVVLQSRRLGRLLFLWKQWAASAEPAAFCERAVQTTEGALAVVKAFSWNNAVVLNNVMTFVPIKAIEKTLRTAEGSGALAPDNVTLIAFRRALASSNPEP